MLVDPPIVLLPLVIERLLAGTISAGPTPASSTELSLLPPPPAQFDGAAIIHGRYAPAWQMCAIHELKCRVAFDVSIVERVSKGRTI